MDRNRQRHDWIDVTLHFTKGLSNAKHYSTVETLLLFRGDNDLSRQQCEDEVQAVRLAVGALKYGLAQFQIPPGNPYRRSENTVRERVRRFLSRLTSNTLGLIIYTARRLFIFTKRTSPFQVCSSVVYRVLLSSLLECSLPLTGFSYRSGHDYS